MTSYAILWSFTVPPEHAAEFERHYGPDGTWARLFAQARGYIGTSLLADTTQAGRYLTIDRWTDEAAYRSFRADFSADYARLDRECERLTAGETWLGAFTERDGGVSQATKPPASTPGNP